MVPKLDKAAIQSVARNLIPIRVLLVRSNVDLADIPAELGDNITVQSAPPRCLEHEASKDGDQVTGYTFHLVAGVRYVNENLVNEDQSNADEFVIGTIISEYMVLFSLRTGEECDEDELSHFAEHNTAFQVWPFWREFCHSACMRAGVEPPQIGMFMLEKYDDEKSHDDEDLSISPKLEDEKTKDDG